jgi:phosphoadenosine phosphosulfate reductase
MKQLEASADADELIDRYEGLGAAELLRRLIEDAYPGRIAVVSSFGADSAVVLALVAEIDRRTPVLFLDTGKLFGETLRYRDRVAERLRLADVRTIQPDPALLRAADPGGVLWATDPDACCHVRKVEPLERALGGFDAWISGRKRHQGGLRSAIPPLELDGFGRLKANPLAAWTREEIEREFARRDLPRHPLEADGFRSIGCMPCTDRVAPDEDSRAGRWRGRGKTECGIHIPAARQPPRILLDAPGALGGSADD